MIMLLFTHNKLLAVYELKVELYFHRVVKCIVYELTNTDLMNMWSDNSYLYMMQHKNAEQKCVYYYQ